MVWCGEVWWCVAQYVQGPWLETEVRERSGELERGNNPKGELSIEDTRERFVVAVAGQPSPENLRVQQVVTMRT